MEVDDRKKILVYAGRRRRCVVVTIKSWNLGNFEKLKTLMPEIDWTLITDRICLTKQKLDDIAPDYVFFAHWSWIIPPEIHKNFRCIVFHMTDLPFGRGGSPLQNLISRGIYQTRISAIKVVDELDAGDVYCKEPLDITLGSAQEIFIRASDLIFGRMIPYILAEKPVATAQDGAVVEFRRRKPADSILPPTADLRKIYDWIRMLDAEGYPSAYLDYGPLRLEFSGADLKEGSVSANVVIRVRDDG